MRSFHQPLLDTRAHSGSGTQIREGLCVRSGDRVCVVCRVSKLFTYNSVLLLLKTKPLSLSLITLIGGNNTLTGFNKRFVWGIRRGFQKASGKRKKTKEQKMVSEVSKQWMTVYKNIKDVQADCTYSWWVKRWNAESIMREICGKTLPPVFEVLLQLFINGVIRIYWN